MRGNTGLQPRRDLGLDLLKAIAILGVLLIHASLDGYDTPVGSVPWMSALFWDSLSQGSVPLFLMCTGALLLNPEREVTVRRICTRYVPRMICSLVVWAMVYHLYCLSFEMGFNGRMLWEAVKRLVLFRNEFHLYFIPLMLIVYAFLPLLRLIVKHASRRQLQYVLGLWFALAVVLPTVLPFRPFRLMSSVKEWQLDRPFAAVGYTLLGWYLLRYPLRARWHWLLAGGGVVLLFGGTLVLSIRSGALNSTLMSMNSVGAAMLGAGLFGLYRRKDRLGRRTASVATALSKSSFFVYLSHILVLYLLWLAGVSIRLLPCPVSIPLLALVMLAICWGCWYILSKIPFINRWLM